MLGIKIGIDIGDLVVGQTSSTKLPDGVLHEAVIIDKSEGGNFFKLRYTENGFEEWIQKYHVERIRKGASNE